MDVKTNSENIKSSRLKRAWSQEHLAHVAGLGLRTIHRIETKGEASLESIKAIASALEVPLNEMMLPPATPKTWLNSLLTSKRVIASFMATICTILTIFVATSVIAEQVMLNVSISVDNEPMGSSQFLTETGADAEFLFENRLKMIIAATVKDNNNLFIETKIFEFNGGDFHLIGAPKLLVENNAKAGISITSDTGTNFQFSITPKIQ